MFKALTPIIGIIVAVGLFFTYIQPTFREIKGIQDEASEYAEATAKAAELQQRINELKQKQSSISLGNLERLEAFLPDRIDEVAVLLDIDALATRYQLKLGDIEVGSGDGPAAQGPQNQPAAANGTRSGVSDESLANDPMRSQYTTLDVSFSVSGDYDNFRMFLEEMERSLVLMEVTKITFSRSEGDTTPFMVSVRLFSLNPPA